MDLPLVKNAPPETLHDRNRRALLLLREGAAPRFATTADLDRQSGRRYANPSTHPDGVLIPQSTLRQLLARAPGADVRVNSRAVHVSLGTFRARLHSPGSVEWYVPPNGRRRGYWPSCEVLEERHWPTARAVEAVLGRVKSPVSYRIAAALRAAER